MQNKDQQKKKKRKEKAIARYTRIYIKTEWQE